jgi:hypothetical protein
VPLRFVARCCCTPSLIHAAVHAPQSWHPLDVSVCHADGLVSLRREFMGAALAMMRRHEDAWPFRDPVSRAEVPDYYDIIRVG